MLDISKGNEVDKAMSEAYFCWLVGLIGNKFLEECYQKLLWKLFTTDFIYELKYDKNRAADGLYLRKIYARETGMTTDFSCENGVVDGAEEGSERTCSVLEMMVALARKAEDDIMHDPDLGDRTGYWFWVMLENLGLDIYDDSYYFEENVDRILDVFMHHRYAPNGTYGGMFSVRKSCRDMRKTDLWWQLNAYFEENYPVPIW